jgi:predicted nucleic acid-binding protein
VREVALDSSVILKWFTAVEEEHQDRARAFQGAFAEGRLRIIAPRLLMLELLNAAAHGWRWSGDQLAALAEDLGELRFELVDPALADVARWAARGLSAYDAAFVAVAEAAGVELVTADRRIVQLAPAVARSLADAA